MSTTKYIAKKSILERLLFQEQEGFRVQVSIVVCPASAKVLPETAWRDASCWSYVRVSLFFFFFLRDSLCGYEVFIAILDDAVLSPGLWPNR